MVASEKFTTQDVGFAVQGPEAVTVTFNVTKDADLTALDCRLVALNTAYGQVGFRDVTIGPGTSERETFTVEVRTSEPRDDRHGREPAPLASALGRAGVSRQTRSTGYAECFDRCPRSRASA